MDKTDIGTVHRNLHYRRNYLARLIWLAVACFGLGACEKGEDPEEVEQTVGSCGVERWSVKTGTDADAHLVNLSPQNTTIAALRALATPSTLPANNRIAPTETTVFRLTNVTLTEYKLETDSDYHLVLSDGTHTMIVEIPSPGCVGTGSVFATGITSARNGFNAHHKATSSFQTAHDTVTLTGAGFFDFLHGQTGVAPNGIELHAVLSLCFGANCT